MDVKLTVIAVLGGIAAAAIGVILAKNPRWAYFVLVASIVAAVAVLLLWKTEKGGVGEGAHAAAGSGPESPCAEAERNWSLTQPTVSLADAKAFRATVPGVCPNLLERVDARIEALAPPPAPSPAPALDPVIGDLADGLDGATFARMGDSCTTEGTRIVVRGDELELVTPDIPARRYVMIDRQNQFLVTRRNGREVHFEVQANGFWYIDEGMKAWYRRCGA